jgi:hypothetical protein
VRIRQHLETAGETTQSTRIGMQQLPALVSPERYGNPHLRYSSGDTDSDTVLAQR